MPEHVVTDGAKEEGNPALWKTNWQKIIKKYSIQQGITQPYCWWQNCVEREIGKIRRSIKWYASRKNSLKRLWFFLVSYVAGKRTMTVQTNPAVMGRIGYEIVLGEVLDITMYVKIG